LPTGSDSDPPTTRAAADGTIRIKAIALRSTKTFGTSKLRSYWRGIMLAKNAAKDVMAAVAVMEHARNACANLSPMGLPMSQAQIEHRARVIAAVINASRKLQQLRDRAVSLEDALARFKARKAELAA